MSPPARSGPGRESSPDRDDMPEHVLLDAIRHILELAQAISFG